MNFVSPPCPKCGVACPWCGKRRNHTRASRAAISEALTQEIEELRPAYVSVDAVKQIMAMYWLDRPEGFWAKLSWAWRLVFWTERKAIGWGGES